MAIAYKFLNFSVFLLGWKENLGTIEDRVNLQIAHSKLSEVDFGGDPNFFLHISCTQVKMRLFEAMKMSLMIS